MNKRKIMMLALSLCMIAILAVGGTLAYFTDTDSATNVFTVGNVQIEQYEKDRNGNDYGSDPKKLAPIVDDSKDTNGYHMGKNYIDKIVTVKNTGTEDAYIRTHIAFPAVLDNGANTFRADKNILHWNGASANDTFGAANPTDLLDNDWYWDADLTTDWPGKGGNWNFYKTTIEGIEYNVYVATHKSAVKAGETTAPNLLGLYLDEKVDYNGTSYVNQDGQTFEFPSKINVLVASEAVQTEGFDNAVEALNKAFGEPSATNNPWTKK